MFKSIVKGALVAASVVLATSAMAKDKIRVGISPEAYPPFTTLNANNKWEGFEIDLLAALCKQMNADCEIVSIAWDGLIPALTGKKIDMIFNSMSITEERMKVIDFSDKYYNSPAEIIGGKGAAKITVVANPDGKGGKIANPADLKGKTIGVQTATIHADYAQKYFKDATVKVYDTADNHNADLVAGRIDYALLDSVAAEDFVKANADKGIENKLIVPADPIFGTGAGAGLRKGDTALKDKINAAIKALRASGEYDTIAKKYFNFDIYGG
jgi:polar amino acid transport system substrate-binding protein